MFKAIHAIVTTYLFDRIVIVLMLTLWHPTLPIDIYRNSFMYMGGNLWRDVPAFAQHSMSIESFNRITQCTDWSLAHYTFLWRHNGSGSVSNDQPHDCLLNCLFRLRSKKTSKLRVTGLCVPGEFPAQMASNADNVSIWWHHHDFCLFGNVSVECDIYSSYYLNIPLFAWMWILFNF